LRESGRAVGFLERMISACSRTPVWGVYATKPLAECWKSVAWNPDGSRLATASDDRTAKVWDAATGKELLTQSGHSSEVSNVAWSPDGKP
jgi:WD40 repeat protein